VLAPVVLLAACNSKATASDTPSNGPTTTAPQAALTKVPTGTVLRVGDQLDYLKTVLKLAGQDQDFPYKVEYSAFIGGPPMLQAFQAGAIDTGFVGSTPLIFAQAGNQDVTAVAGWASQHGSYGLVTAPGKKAISSWGDLKGHSVAYQQGTAGEAVLLEYLDEAGLTLKDVTPVNLPQTQVSAALQGGSADAAVQTEPLTSAYLASNPTAKQVDDTTLITDRSDFVIASKSTLDDKGKSAALADYVNRLVTSFNYLRAHPDQIATAVYVNEYHLSPDRATALVKAAGTISFVQLPGDIVKAQQHLADLFHTNGEIPAKVDVTREFDARFNALVQKAQGS
jgi:sulfonate transport system substrate-binding protein